MVRRLSPRACSAWPPSWSSSAVGSESPGRYPQFPPGQRYRGRRPAPTAPMSRGRPMPGRRCQRRPRVLWRRPPLFLSLTEVDTAAAIWRTLASNASTPPCAKTPVATSTRVSWPGCHRHDLLIAQPARPRLDYWLTMAWSCRSRRLLVQRGPQVRPPGGPALLRADDRPEGSINLPTEFDQQERFGRGSSPWPCSSPDPTPRSSTPETFRRRRFVPTTP
jgi:hypothetical protein